jgi:hypothetical protein
MFLTAVFTQSPWFVATDDVVESVFSWLSRIVCNGVVVRGPSRVTQLAGRGKGVHLVERGQRGAAQGSVGPGHQHAPGLRAAAAPRQPLPCATSADLASPGLKAAVDRAVELVADLRYVLPLPQWGRFRATSL